MPTSLSIFLDFNLPNATTWFYFSFLLAIALFFKFGRLATMRNWDVVMLFLLVPGLLIVQASRPNPTPSPTHPAIRVAALIGQGGGAAMPAAPTEIGHVGFFVQSRDPALTPGGWLWLGYLWLMIGSAYFLLRCLFDLALVQRPALAPNLTFGGLAFLAIALMVCLIAVAFRPTVREPFATPKLETPPPATKPVGPESATLALAREWIEPRWWLARGSAVACHLAVVVGLVLVGKRHFQDAAAGMAAATFYLMLPYTGIFISQVHHVLPMAMIIWALVVSSWPTLSGMLLGLATGTAYFPVVLLPMWIGYYWGRGAGRFTLAFLLTCSVALAAIGLTLYVDGTLEASLAQVEREAAWQPWKGPTTESFWTGVHPAYRIPVFIGYIAFLIATIVWPMPKNLAHLIALSAALLIGVQFWYADQGGVYVLWYLPLLLLLVFRPNLAERRPPEINPDTDWLCRARRGLGALVGKLLRPPEPATPTEQR